MSPSEIKLEAGMVKSLIPVFDVDDLDDLILRTKISELLKPISRPDIAKELIYDNLRSTRKHIQVELDELAAFRIVTLDCFQRRSAYDTVFND
jgi:hypothetical protein